MSLQTQAHTHTHTHTQPPTHTHTNIIHITAKRNPRTPAVVQTEMDRHVLFVRTGGLGGGDDGGAGGARSACPWSHSSGCQQP